VAAGLLASKAPALVEGGQGRTEATREPKAMAEMRALSATSIARVRDRDAIKSGQSRDGSLPPGAPRPKSAFA
jgi:hypothetical protein